METKSSSPPSNGERGRRPAALDEYARDSRDRYVRLARRWCRRFRVCPIGLGPEGAVHNAWLVLLAALDEGRLEPIASPDHFHKLFTRLLRNAIIDESRRQHAFKRHGGATIVALDVDGTGALADLPDERLTHEETLAELLELLDREEKRLRTIVDRRLMGCSRDEIARELGTSAATVRRGLATVRLLLAPYVLGANVA